MKLKAVFFDLDGTLAETEILHLECFNYAFQKFSLDWYWSKDLYKQLIKIGGGKERIRYYQKEFTSQLLSETDIELLHKQKTICYQKKLESGVPLRTGVYRLLKELKEFHIATALVTTSSKSSVIPFIRSSIPEEIQFDCILTGDDVRNKKPDPELYLKALEILRCSSHSGVAIEDSESGLLASVGAGLKTIITPNFFTIEHDFQKSYSVITHLGELHNPFSFLSGIKLPKNIVDVEVLEFIIGHGYEK